MGDYGDTPSVDGWTKPTRVVESEEEWKNIWEAAAHSNTVNVPRTAAEFYMLEIISAHVGITTPGVGAASELPITPDEFFALFKIEDANIRERLLETRRDRIGNQEPVESLAAVRRCAIVQMAELVDAYTPTFYEYLNLAIGGEMRHHKAGSKVLNPTRSIAWCDWQEVFETHGVDAIRTAAELFREFPRNSGYGGAAWAQAADILAAFIDGRLGPDEATNARLFLDRVWTLEHNNGCILNKAEWIDLEHIQKVLNAHAANPPDLRTLYKRSGPEVQELWKQYMVACNVLRLEDRLDPVDFNFDAALVFGKCHCGSNVQLGHKYQCTAHKAFDFNDGKFDKETPTSWYFLVDEEDHHNDPDLLTPADHLPFTPQGIMAVDSSQEVRYKVTIRVYDDDDNEIGIYDTSYLKTTFGEMIEVDFDPSSIVPTWCWDQHKNIEFRFSCYAQSDDLDIFRIARMYQLHPEQPFAADTVNIRDWMHHCTGAPIEAS